MKMLGELPKVRLPNEFELVLRGKRVEVLSRENCQAGIARMLEWVLTSGEPIDPMLLRSWGIEMEIRERAPHR